MYNIEKDEWTEGPFLVDKTRSNFCCCAHKNMIYVVGGSNSNSIERVNA